MIVYVVNATLVSMKWRWNWFSFQRFHSLPQNFMLDCQSSETHGLPRGLEMMCVTRHSKMWELEPHLSQGRPLRLIGCIWPGSQGNPCPECRWGCCPETEFSPSNMNSTHRTISFPAQGSGGISTEPLFPENLLRASSHLGSKRRWRTSLRKLVI